MTSPRPSLARRSLATFARLCRPPLAPPDRPGHAAHLIPASRLADLRLPLGDDGLVIGRDAAGTEQLIGLQRPEPYPVVLVGGLWTAQILALRAAATGIRVAVETGRAPAWSAVAGAGAPGPNPVTLHRVGGLPPLDPAPTTPALAVRDCGVQPPRPPAATPWQSVLTLLPHLGPAAPRLLRTAALVGLQRLSPEEVEQAAPVLGLTRQERALLPGLPDGVTLWCAGADRRRITTTVTDAETGLLGNPRRID